MIGPKSGFVRCGLTGRLMPRAVVRSGGGGCRRCSGRLWPVAEFLERSDRQTKIDLCPKPPAPDPFSLKRRRKRFSSLGAANRPWRFASRAARVLSRLAVLRQGRQGPGRDEARGPLPQAETCESATRSDAPHPEFARERANSDLLRLSKGPAGGERLRAIAQLAHREIPCANARGRTTAALQAAYAALYINSTSPDARAVRPGWMRSYLHDFPYRCEPVGGSRLGAGHGPGCARAVLGRGDQAVVCAGGEAGGAFRGERLRRPCGRESLPDVRRPDLSALLRRQPARAGPAFARLRGDCRSLGPRGDELPRHRKRRSGQGVACR